ncbi:MAG: hypothetical protein ACRC1M_01220, partial [Methanobacteriaceae archaeon]
MRLNKVFLLVIVLLSVLMLVSVLNPVSAATKVVNLGTFEADTNNTLYVQNDNAPKFVKALKNPSSSKLYKKTKGFETKRNIIETKLGNKKYTFKTEYFLPMSGKKGTN